MPLSPEELERQRQTATTGFKPATNRPQPAPQKKKTKPDSETQQRPLTQPAKLSPEMAGVDSVTRWPKPDDVSLAMSVQKPLNMDPQGKVLKADRPRVEQPQTENNLSAGFKASIPGRIVGAIKGDNPIPGTGGLYEAVNKRGPKIVSALQNGEYANAAGQAVGIPGDAFRYGLYGGMQTAEQTAEALPDVAAGFGKFAEGIMGKAPNPEPMTAGHAKVPAAEVDQASTDPKADGGENNNTATAVSATTSSGYAQEDEPGAQALTNNITMTVDDNGVKSFSGRNVGAGATLNGQPFSRPMNVVSSEGMKRLTGADRAPQQMVARQQAPGMGFAPQQQSRRTPKSAFEEQVEREIFRQATTAMRGAQNGQLTASQRGSLDKLAGNMSGERNGLDLQAMRNDGMLGQTAMIQAGQGRRDAGRLALDASRLAGDQYAQGFQIRQNERLEGLRQAYESAETDDQRSAIAEQLRILNGDNEQGAMYDSRVVDGMDANGNPVQTLYTINQRTGQAQAVKPQQQYQVGAVYNGADGQKARFAGYDSNGKAKWEAVN